MNLGGTLPPNYWVRWRIVFREVLGMAAEPIGIEPRNRNAFWVVSFRGCKDDFEIPGTSGCMGPVSALEGAELFMAGLCVPEPPALLLWREEWEARRARAGDA